MYDLKQEKWTIKLGVCLFVWYIETLDLHYFLPRDIYKTVRVWLHYLLNNTCVSVCWCDCMILCLVLDFRCACFLSHYDIVGAFERALAMGSPGKIKNTCEFAIILWSTILGNHILFTLLAYRFFACSRVRDCALCFDVRVFVDVILMYAHLIFQGRYNYL